MPDLKYLSINIILFVNKKSPQGTFNQFIFNLQIIITLICEIALWLIVLSVLCNLMGGPINVLLTPTVSVLYSSVY